MSNAKHTPGPWYVFGNGHCVGGPFSSDDPDESGRKTAGIAMCGMRLRSPDESEANARLIAAAPDLLTTLEHIAGVSKRHTDGSARFDAELLKDIRKAIAKAKGEQS